MQKELNERFYLMIQQEIRNLALRSCKMSYGELMNEFDIIREKVLWSNWGIQGNLTKKALMEYLDVLFDKILKQEKGFKFLGSYLFNREVKEYRKLLHKRYLMDFKEWLNYGLE